MSTVSPAVEQHDYTDCRQRIDSCRILANSLRAAGGRVPATDAATAFEDALYLSEQLLGMVQRYEAEFVAADAERARLAALLNTPEIHDFAAAVMLEAAHQRERWQGGHDQGKTDADWFWLIGYLAGKALHNPPHPEIAAADKQLHRIITIAAAAANWHAAVKKRGGES